MGLKKQPNFKKPRELLLKSTIKNIQDQKLKKRGDSGLLYNSHNEYFKSNFVTVSPHNKSSFRFILPHMGSQIPSMRT